MTRRHDLELRRDSLAEVRDIMNSMKTLAYMETRKLARFLDAQGAVVRNIENVAADLIDFHPESMPEQASPAPAVCLVIGTQRGFCGDFNRALLEHLKSGTWQPFSAAPLIIAVGHRLYTLLEGDPRLAARIEGASIAEEVTDVLGRAIEELARLQHRYPLLAVFALYHGSDGGIVMQKLLPPFQNRRPPQQPLQYPPLMHETPRQLLGKLTDHYLFAALNEILYGSLMTENHQRLTHLEAAVKHLDDQSAKLTRRCNSLRQEEIIEEIEVILLSAGDPGRPGAEH
jgi:F-type H+-transporting ATPase subunit gamma